METQGLTRRPLHSCKLCGCLRARESKDEDEGAAEVLECSAGELCSCPMKYSESEHVAHKTAWTRSRVALGHSEDLWVRSGARGAGEAIRLNKKQIRERRGVDGPSAETTIRNGCEI